MIFVSLIQQERLAVLGPCFLRRDVERSPGRKAGCQKLAPCILVDSGIPVLCPYCSMSENILFYFFPVRLPSFLVVNSGKVSLLLVFHRGQPYFSD